MASFYVVEIETGLVKRSGTIDVAEIAAQAHEGEKVYEGICPDDHDIDLATGEFVRRPDPPPAPPPTVQQLRARNYPDIRDQLDALWKGGADMDAMRVTIMAVKAKYPKAPP